MSTDKPTREEYKPVSHHRTSPVRDYSDSPLSKFDKPMIALGNGEYKEEDGGVLLDEEYERHRHLIQARQQDEALAAACQDAKEAVRVMHEVINALPPSTARDNARENMLRVEAYLRSVIYAIDPDGEK